MVEDYGRGQRFQQVGVPHNLLGRPVQLHMPSQEGDTLRKPRYGVEVAGFRVRGMKAEAYAAYAAFVKLDQLRVRYGFIDNGDAASVIAAQSLNGMQGGAVVSTVEPGLNDDGAGQTQPL